MASKQVGSDFQLESATSDYWTPWTSISSHTIKRKSSSLQPLNLMVVSLFPFLYLPFSQSFFLLHLLPPNMSQNVLRARIRTIIAPIFQREISHSILRASRDWLFTWPKGNTVVLLSRPWKSTGWQGLKIQKCIPFQNSGFWQPNNTTKQFWGEDIEMFLKKIFLNVHSMYKAQ